MKKPFDQKFLNGLMSTVRATWVIAGQHTYIMRLRKSSKWLLLTALVAFASVLHEFPGAEATKKGSKKGSKSSSPSSSSTSRSRSHRTKGKKSSSSSSAISSSSSSSASVEYLMDRVGNSGAHQGGLNTAHYSKVFKKGAVSSSSASREGGGKGTKKGSRKSSKGKKNKVTIITPSPITTSTTTEEPVGTSRTVERLTTIPMTKKTRTRVSFGLGHDSGIHASSWVGIDNVGGSTSVTTTKGGVGIGEVIRVVPDEAVLGGGGSNYFIGATKDYRPLER